MAKKPTVTTIASGYASTTTLNNNFEALRDGFDNTLSLDGSTPNAMQADLDMDGNDILDAGSIIVGGQDLLAATQANLSAAAVAQADAEAAVTAAETSETNAATSATSASTSASSAATNASQAASSALAASGSATASATSALAAENAETGAETAETNAQASALAALASEIAAGTSETNAAASETSASTSETNAAASAAAALASETAAAASEAGVDADRVAAEAAATAAAASETAASTSETNAATSETNAASSASAASTSETNAAASETAASASEANAAASEAASSTSETNAAASAAAASASETNAATSETNAANSATASASSATASAASATAASASETAAASSETAAAASEAAASTSETNAAASETAAAASETAAASSASSASTSASNAASSASSASASADAALAALDNFDDRYLGQKASDPTLDNDGDALVAGALYFNTTDEIMKVFDGSLWVAAYASLSGAMFGANNLSDVASASDSRANLGLGTAATTASTDYATAAQGALADSAVQPNDSPTFAGLTTTGNVSFGDNDKAIFGAGSDLQIYAAGGNSFIQDTGSGSLFVTGASGMYLQNGSNETYLDAFSNGAVRLFHDNAQKLSTTSTGIDVTGTVTADGLTVDGDAAILDSTGNTDFDVGGGTGQGTLRVYSPSKANSFSVLNNGTAFLTMSDGEIQYRSKGTSGQHSFKTTDSNTNRMIVANNGDISFYEDTGTTPKFFWDASDERLGIGTASPDRSLSISNSGTAASAMFRRSDAAVSLIDFRDSTSTSGTQVRLGCVGDNAVFYAGAAERMRIDSSGNVGIGTSSPSEKLQVAGVVLASQRFETTNQTVLRSTAAGGNNYLDFNTGTSSGNIIFRNGSSLFEDMRIDSSGNLEMTGGGSVGWANWTITESGGSLYFATGGTNKMKLDASGNLQVVGNVESNATIT